MAGVILGLAMLAGAAPAAALPADGLAVAKRVVAAIKGGTEFQDADFARALGAEDKAALRRFASCKVAEITYTLMPDPIERDTYIQNRNDVLVRFGCKGVSTSTPVGLSLHLNGGKIETIETHNADLMRIQ